MSDRRTDVERSLDAVLGPPLYYCSDCLRGVRVTIRDGEEPLIARPCGQDCGYQIIAPRKAIAAGEGGLNFKDRVKVAWWQLAAALTGRCV